MKASVKGFQDKQVGSGALFEDVYLLEGKRTPFGKYTGSLSTVSPTDLGILASRAAIEASGVPAGDIDQTIVANIGQASADCFFLPRHIALYSGAPLASTALLTQRICGSGMELLGQAAEQIALGKANLVLGCGTDTMSRFPLASYSARQGFQLGRPEFVDLLWEALNDTAAVPMGCTADNLAKQYSLSRQDVDAFAMRSQQRYANSYAAGFFE
ncbi:MAG: acetyl-CoA C-acyltransferase, partial [Desulfuromonadales bacterium]|nr:acetyl-CoA C-acyltransferase [Desulfuromonadales bacterium]